MPVHVRIFLEVRQSSRLHSTTHTETGMLNESLYYVHLGLEFAKYIQEFSQNAFCFLRKNLISRK